MALPRSIFTTQLSPQAVYFIQTGGSALHDTYCIFGYSYSAS